MIHAKINHYAISVRDLSRSIYFYQDILGFHMLSRPSFDFDGTWFDIGHGLQLHLIEDRDVNIQSSSSRSLHFAFAVPDIVAAKTYLINKGIDIIKDIKVRPDEIWQMFIKDPDGYFIELTEIVS